MPKMYQSETWLRREYLTKKKKPAKIAEEDACIIEHQLNSKTMEQLVKFVKFIENAPVYPKWVKHFKIYCDTGKHPVECKLKK